MTKKTLTVLTFFYFLSLFTKIYFLKNNSLTFGYDQARDAFQAQSIINGDLKIQGPPSSTKGLFHGVLWYYFLVIPNLISHNLIFSAIFLAFFNSLNVFVVFYLSILLTKNLQIGLLSSFLYAISFEASQYAVWLSNPTIAAVFVPLVYLSLWILINSNNKSMAYLLGLFFGLSVHSEIFLAYHIIPILIWFSVAKVKNKLLNFTKFIVTFILVISTFIISEFKFGFNSINGLVSLLSKGSITTSESLGAVFVRFLDQIGRVYAYNFYPSNIALGSGIVIFFMFIAYNSWNHSKNLVSWQPFLIVWMLSHISVVAIGGDSTPFLLVGIGPAVTILVSILIVYLSNRKYFYVGLVFLLMAVYGNLSAIHKENNRGQTIFSIQKDMILRNQLNVIDYTYESSNGESFSVNTVTSPLWINIVWTYLYKNFGEPKYHSLPYWHGRDQIGQIDSLSNLDKREVKYYYLIIEPIAGIPQRFVDEEIQSEDSKYLLLEEKSFGEIIVQKRIEKKYE